MKLEILDGNMLKDALAGSSKFLESKKEEVNSLNVFPVPDGDTGTNMSLTLKSAFKQGLTVEENHASKVALAASQGSLMGARGNSGVILSQLFRGFALGLEDKAEVTTRELARGLKKAADTAYKAVMKPTEGTILTVARECGEYAMAIYQDEKDILKFLEKVIIHGNKALDKTPDMLPVLKEAGVVDAGGKGYMYVIEGGYRVLAGLEVADYEEKPQESLVNRKPLSTEDIKFGYCTEFMIDSKDVSDLSIEDLKEKLQVQGDSLMVVGAGDIIKVHVHTNNPGLALEKGLKFGELKDIKIDNMRYQHQERLFKDYGEEEHKVDKKYSFVSVSIGEGIDEVFKGLNVEGIVPGGQTMNPSTEDIVKAIEKTRGENVFILPNNSNIILAAEQAVEISSRKVIVIPTKTVPQGISSLLAFDEESSVEENLDNMLEAMAEVKTGQVTYAVRDTEYDGKEIKKDDIIGLEEGKITITGKSINQVGKDLIDSMVDEDISLITIIYGKDQDESQARELEEIISREYEDVDVELIPGGQPLYYYIFSLE